MKVWDELGCSGISRTKGMGIQMLPPPHLSVMFLLSTLSSLLAHWHFSQTENIAAHRLQVFHPIVQTVTLPFFSSSLVEKFQVRTPLGLFWVIYLVKKQ